MNSLRKFQRLPPHERVLLVQTCLLVAAVRLGLWVLPVRVVLRLARRAPPAAHPPGDIPFTRLAWAVSVASCYTPAATCLVQALAAQVLLQWHGYPASLRIGVARDSAGRFAAHAWLESDDQIVIGGTSETLARYIVLPSVQ